MDSTPLSPIASYVAYGLIGLGGGTLGGMLGIGGGLIVIPALSILFGEEHQHEYQAALMLVYIVVALSATARNMRSGFIRADCLRGVVPASLATIVVGVWLSNQMNAIELSRLFSLFLAYVLLVELRRLVHAYRGRGRRKVGVQCVSRPAGQSEPPGPAVSLARSTLVGLIMGFFSGLLGIGGGAVAVPLQQLICRLNLKESIATSTTAILGTGLVGTAAKCISLQPDAFGSGLVGRIAAALAASDPVTNPNALKHALTLAAALAPGALAGGYIGASLTQRIRAFWIRLVFAAFVFISAFKMSGVLDLF